MVGKLGYPNRQCPDLVGAEQWLQLTSFKELMSFRKFVARDVLLNQATGAAHCMYVAEAAFEVL